MKKEVLLEKTEEWKALERKTDQQRKIAEAFYEEKLMKLIEESFIENNRENLFEDVEYLVMSVGTSYEPLVLNIQLTKPKKILFLYTEETEAVLEKIVNYCQLPVSIFDKRQVHETNPIDTYREIKGAYLRWRRPGKIYIDFTGGTKAMSAAAAMAGAMIQVQLIYVGTNEYLNDFRKPNPGSERMCFIDNPLALFGDLEIEKAFVLFTQNNYAGAKEKLRLLRETVPEPNIRQQLNFAYQLAQTYESWDALEFVQAYQYMEQLNKEIRRDYAMHPDFLMMDFRDQLMRQEQILQHLYRIPKMLQEKKQMSVLKNKEKMAALMFTMYENALIRERQDKYDMATLLLYRLLEMIEQKRLAIYNLYVSKMDYAHIKYNKEQTPEVEDMSAEERIDWLKETMKYIKKQLFKRETNSYLPEQISLLEGFMLLLALEDEISMQENGKEMEKLKRIRSMVYLRNNSIFAHGLGPVAKKDFLKFKEFVQYMFREFCRIEQIDFERYSRDITWLNPIDSVYYTGMGNEDVGSLH